MRVEALCSKCGKNPVFFCRRYSGEKLCKRCFTRSIEKKVVDTIGKYSMFSYDDRIAVALSGGKDSLTLLHILEKIERRFPRAKLFAITIDEGISGYRDEAIKLAQKQTSKLGIEHIVISFKEIYGHEIDELAEKAKQHNLSPCSICGVLRRTALNIAARKYGATKLATAHNLDDEVQTILINLIRSDVYRLYRLGPVLRGENFVPRVKPLCKIPEDEVALYAYLTGIEFQSVACPYSPYTIRSLVRNFLNELEHKYPGSKFAIYRTIEKVKPSLSIEKNLKFCKNCGEVSTSEMCRTCDIIVKLTGDRWNQGSIWRDPRPSLP